MLIRPLWVAVGSLDVQAPVLIYGQTVPPGSGLQAPTQPAARQMLGS
jgi:hypothetical protein